MKKFMKFALLAALILAFFATAASAADTYIPRAEKIVEVGGKLYGLTSYAVGYSSYKASEVIEFDTDLKPLRRVKLEIGTEGSESYVCAMNTEKDFVVRGTKLYIPTYGGYQGSGSFGDIWTVDTTDMSVKRIVDTTKVDALKASGEIVMALVYTLAFNGDDAYVGVQTNGGKNSEGKYVTVGKLFKTTVAKLEQGDLGTPVELNSAFPLHAEVSGTTLWTLTGNGVERRNADMSIVQTITEADLGQPGYAIVPMKDAGDGKPGFFYYASNYSAGVIGTIVTNNDSYKAVKIEAAYGGDALPFVYVDGSNTEHPVLFEHNTYSKDSDSIYVWGSINDLGDKGKAVNKKIDAYNVHGAVVVGDNMYLACYGISGAFSGEFVRLAINDSFKRTAYYTPDAINESTEPEIGPAPVTPTADVKVVSATIPSSDVFKAVVANTDLAGLLDTASNIAKLADDKLPDLLNVALADDAVKFGDVDEDSLVALPIVSADVEKGKVAAIGFSVPDIGTGYVDNINVLKVRSSDEVIAFDLVEKPDDFADGKFAVFVGNDIQAKGTALDPTKSYTIVLFVKDNAKYDLNEADGAVLDPAMLVKSYAHSGSSSGGCDMGAGVIALIALGALTIKRRQR